MLGRGADGSEGGSAAATDCGDNGDCGDGGDGCGGIWSSYTGGEEEVEEGTGGRRVIGRGEQEQDEEISRTSHANGSFSSS